MMCARAEALRSMIAIPYSARTGGNCFAPSIRAHPRMAFKGVRSSCDTVARNSSLRWLVVGTIRAQTMTEHAEQAQRPRVDDAHFALADEPLEPLSTWTLLRVLGGALLEYRDDARLIMTRALADELGG